MLKRITEPNAQGSVEDLASFAERHGLQLPVRYSAFLLANNGGRPEPSAFPIEGLHNNPFGTIQVFFSLNAGASSSNLDWVLADIDGLVPKGILPIATTDSGDYVCLDLRRPAGPVVFWDRRRFWGTDVWNEDDLHAVAPNFAALLRRLRDLED